MMYQEPPFVRLPKVPTAVMNIDPWISRFYLVSDWDRVVNNAVDAQ